MKALASKASFGITLIALALTFSAATAQAKPKKEKDGKEAVGSIPVKGKVKPADLPALAKISFADALKAAETAGAGTAIEGELKVDDGCLIYSFDIVTAAKAVVEVEIDAGDGKVLEIEAE